MNTLSSLYGASLSLLTDLYLLTMAHGYWKTGKADCEAAFHLFYRRNPFKGGFAVAAGLSAAAEFIENLRFDADDLAYLATLTGNDGRPLFGRRFSNISASSSGRATWTPFPRVRWYFRTSRLSACAVRWCRPSCSKPRY